MDEVEAFIAAWLGDNAGVIEEVVALVGDDPHTPYGAALAAALAGMPDWKPSPKDPKGGPI